MNTNTSTIMRKYNSYTKINHQRAYVNNIPIRHGEVTLVTSDNAEASMVHSTRLGAGTQKAGVPTLIINAGISRRVFAEHFHAHAGKQIQPHLVLHTTVRGDLVGEREEIEHIVTEANIGVVIIAGWEWASSSFRRKQRLIFFLRELMDLYNVAVIIYSHTDTSPTPRMRDHGGVGNLGLLVMFVATIDSSEVLEELVKKPTPATYGSEAEYQAAERSAQLLINQINGIEGGNGEITNEELGITNLELVEQL